MVPNATSVVAELVHHLVHRERFAAWQWIDLRLIVGQGGALNGVAVVKKQCVGELFASLCDSRRNALKTHGFIFRELEVVVAQDVGVQVGGF